MFYVHALQQSTLALWELGDIAAAVARYQEMLRLNPGDNQGARYHLLSCLLELGDDQGATALFPAYDDASADWMYGRALGSFRRDADSAATRRVMGEALDANEYMPAYVVGEKKVPRELPGEYSWGSESEAIIYAADAKRAWEAANGAVPWLAECSRQHNRMVP